MPEGLSNNISQEQINNLAKLVSGVEGLLDRHAEIISQILAGEVDIGKLRISYLQEYFDIYSKSLDKIARKHSLLNDTLLIIDEKLTKSYKATTTTSYTSSSGSGGGGNNTPTNRGGGQSQANEPPKPANNVDVSALLNKTTEELAKELKDFADDLASFYKNNEEERRNIIINTAGAINAIEEHLAEQRKQRYSELEEHKKSIENSIMELEGLRYQKEEDQQAQLTEYRLSSIKTTLDAEIEAQKLINEMQTSIDYSSTLEGAEEIGKLRARNVQATENIKSLETLEQQMIERRAELEYQARKKHNGELLEEDLIAIEKKLAEEHKQKLENLKDFEKKRFEEERKTKAKENTKLVENAVSGSLTKENNLLERIKTLNNVGRDEETGERSLKAGLAVMAVAISNLAKQLETKVDEIGKYKGAIDTRLQGSSNEKRFGSYWDQLTREMTRVGAITPFFRQDDFAKNIQTLVDSGIAFDLKQRAFLMTIHDKIATTFNAAEGTLLRLIRIQQEDSTAGRLGMESALNTFLNSMYENTEYLQNVASGVRTSLEEMQALLAGAEATEIEYQVQKWMGSLFSVGMSQEAVNSIAGALGQIASGQVDGLTNGGAGNLLIMAANNAGIPIADMLIKGIDASETNKLLQATVNYLAEIAKASADNRVVQQQLANVFGVKASDLRAATNLASNESTIKAIFSESKTYDGMLDQLNSMAGSMVFRTSIGEMMTNIWENGMYSISSGMANNPISYITYKLASILDAAVGGIPIPALSYVGTGIDLETTVADLMRVAAVGGGLLSQLGPIIQGLGSSFSGRQMLRVMGIKSGFGLEITPRGSGVGSSASASNSDSSSLSMSGYVGNASGSDVKNATLQEAEESKKQQMIEAREEEGASEITALNETVVKIYELLDGVANGSSCFTVKVAGYGLTNTTTHISGAMAGLDGVANTSYSSSGAGGNTGHSNNTLAGTGTGSSMDFGGWTTI